MRAKGVWCLTVAALLGLGGRVWADEWRGWRGLEAQGKSRSDNGPTAWSPDQNVVWKTPIPGRGHSSPVVTRDSVFATTGYPAEAVPLVKRAGIGLVLAAFAALAALAVAFLVRSCWPGSSPSWREFLGTLVLCVLLGVVAHFVFVSYVFLPAGETGHSFRQARWQLSSVVVCLGLMIAASRFSPRSRPRVALGAGALLFAVLALMGRPDQDYYRPMGGSEFGGLIAAVPALVLAVGVTLLLRALLARPSTESSPPPQGRTVSVPLALVRLGLVGAVSLVALAGLRLHVPQVAMKIARHMAVTTPGTMSAFAWPNIVLPIPLVAGALWLVAEVAGLWPRRVRLGRLFAAGILCAAALLLIERNWLGTRREFTRAIVCLDRASGRMKWVRPCAPGPEFGTHPMNSQATPTPAVDDERVYAYFGSHGLVCADFSGKILWTNKELPFEGDIHGVGASPILAEGRIVIDSGQPNAPYLAAVDSASGKTLWKTPRPSVAPNHGEHRPPTLASVDGRKVIIIWGWYELRAYDFDSGKELCCYPIERKAGCEIVASLLVDGDTLYLPQVFTFRALSLTKLLKGEDPLVWTADLNGRGPNTSSPVLAKGLLFMVSDTKGHVTCLDAKTGALVW
ncbi:MAG TPA: PQQ-binding-like beta-propeller repeat protein [Planctomycetota bacterium]|nr:PQQ-binding-like beta-propeller repeat protein [Planctomycetota bacterium]HRR78812.1 PQQ-binding-like beta-propeller repeat protein [Planctomycetota bacterium]HRT92881.1 PQQ-binding-like beta-propeller repeat protein [Planctomycetota bacterium]